MRITVSDDALAAHDAHQDGRDLIPAPETCSATAVPPPGVDVCPNLSGDQAVVPDQFVRNAGGQPRA